MKFLGIDFAPLNIPLERRLQTLAAGAWFNVLAFGPFICTFLTFYIIFNTKFWWLMLIYLYWILMIDNKTSEKGGRQIQYVKNWKWWKYMTDYFPYQLVKQTNFELDPKRNYMFACFPHGILPVGTFSMTSTNYGPFKEYFPHHKQYCATLGQHFNVPFYRELILSVGAVSSSKESIEYLAQHPNGGQIISILVGGVQEAYFSRPGDYYLVLKKRKGFVKLALKSGCPLVPVFSFGEIQTFRQLDSPPNSFFHRFQEFFRRIIGIAPILPIGRGFFQYSLGLVPRRHKITTVGKLYKKKNCFCSCLHYFVLIFLVGKPINVEKIENPTAEQIDDLHNKFVEALQDLFNKEKYKYEDNPDDVKLILV